MPARADFKGTRMYGALTVLVCMAVLVDAQWPEEGEEINTLQGRHIGFGTYVGNPYAVFDNKKIGNARYSGVVPDLIRKMSEMNGFNYTLYNIFRDQTHPRQKERGAYLYGLNFNETERPPWQVVFTVFIANAERQAKLDLAFPWFASGYQLAVRRDRKRSHGLSSFVAPFTKDLWMAIGFCTVGVAVMLYIVDEGGRNSRDHGQGKLSFEVLRLGKYFYVTGTALLQQLSHRPSSMAASLVTLGLLLIAFVLASSYAATLTVFLIGDEFTELSGIEDIASGKFPSRRVILYNFGATPTYFEEQVLRCTRTCKPGTEDCSSKRCYDADGNLPYLTCRNVEDCTEGLNNGTADALLMAAPSLQYAINTAYCNRLMTVGSTFNEFNYVAYLAKDSPLTRPLSDAILGLVDSGGIEVATGDVYQSDRCRADDGDGNEPVSLYDLQGIFLVTGCLCAIGVAVFLYYRRALARMEEAEDSDRDAQTIEDFRSYMKDTSERSRFSGTGSLRDQRRSLVFNIMRDLLGEPNDTRSSSNHSHDD